MAIRRDELVKGQWLYEKSRHSAGGAAVQVYRRRVKVLDWNRGAALVQFEDGREKTIPFNDLEPDDAWLEEYQKKQEEKRARIAQERELSLVAAPKEPEKPALTYTLAEKLAAEDEEEQDEEPAEETIAQRRAREEAMRAIDALKSAPQPSPTPQATLPSTFPYDYTTREGREEAARYACSRLDAGASLREVSPALRVTVGTLSRWVDAVRSGVPLNASVGRPVGAKSVALPPEQRSELRTAVHKGELSRREAAEMYGVALSTVDNIMNEIGIPPPPPEPAPMPAVPRTSPEPTEPVRAGAVVPIEVRRQIVAKVDALMAAPPYPAKGVACATAGTTPPTYNAWKRDLESGRTPHQKTYHPAERQKAIAKLVLNGALTTLDAEQRFRVRRNTVQLFVRKLRAGEYDGVADIDLHDPSQPRTPSEPPPPPPPVVVEPPPPPPPPMVVEVPAPLMQAAPTSGAQVVIDEMAKRIQALEAENARLKAKIKQLLPLILDHE